MLRRTVNEQIHQDCRQARQHGQDALQVEEAQDEAERPHANHIGHPEIADQLTGVAEAHAEAFGIFRYPGDKAQLAEDVAQRGDGKEQHADAPFLFHYRLAVFRQRFVAKHRELTAESQHENSNVDQADTGVNPVPLDAAR